MKKYTKTHYFTRFYQHFNKHIINKLLPLNVGVQCTVATSLVESQMEKFLLVVLCKLPVVRWVHKL